MTYVLLIYRASAAGALAPGLDEDATLRAHRALQKETSKRGDLHAVARLDESRDARTVRRKGGSHEIIDGPFIETKEWLVGSLTSSVDGALGSFLPGGGAFGKSGIASIAPVSTVAVKRVRSKFTGPRDWMPRFPRKAMNARTVGAVISSTCLSPSSSRRPWLRIPSYRFQVPGQNSCGTKA